MELEEYLERIMTKRAMGQPVEDGLPPGEYSIRRPLRVGLPQFVEEPAPTANDVKIRKVGGVYVIR